MGLLANRIENQSHRILSKEVAKLGGSLELLEAIDLAAQPGMLRTLGTSMLGGSTQPTRLRLYELTLDQHRAIFVRPFAGAIMHPAEIHAILPGAPRSAVARTIDGWVGDAKELATDAELAAALKKFSWRLQTHLVFQLPWALQIRALGDGTSQLVMSSGTYSGLFSVTYGLAVFQQVAAHVARILAGGSAAAQELALPCFGELARTRLVS